MRIRFIGHSYHKKTRSSQFFLDFLSRFGGVDVLWDDSWRSAEHTDYGPSCAGYDLVVVWQTPEVIERLARTGLSNLVFVPMYDAAYSLSRRFWRKLWHVRILCFSAALYEICLRHGLHCFYLKYYPDREGDCVEDKAKIARSLFVWQRRDNPSWSTVARHIPSVCFKSLHIHYAPDFKWCSLTMPTEGEAANLALSTSEWFEDKRELVSMLERYEYFLAPRDREGIGLSFLDAMVAGMIVVGLDFSTLNEYVIDGINGFLFRQDDERRFDLPDRTDELRKAAQHYLDKGRRNYERRLPSLSAFLLTEKCRGSRFRLHSKISRKIKMANVVEVRPNRTRYGGSQPPMVSVVTVVRNDRPGLSRTLQSVFSQSFRNFEYIIVDGASTDGTRKFLASFDACLDRWISEPDGGAYDAMMKGARMATGKYVLFMNAGDEFVDNFSLEDAFQDLDWSPDVIYGHHFYINDRGRPQVRLARNLIGAFEDLKEGRFTSGWLSGIPCHQSTLVKRDLLLKLGFDLKYSIAADHHLLYRAIADGASCYHTNTFIAKYYWGGMSAQRVKNCIDDWLNIAREFTAAPDRAHMFFSAIA